MRRGHIIYAIITVILGSFLISDQSLSQVLISKLRIAGTSNTDEYVELYNYSSTTAFLAGWKLTKLTSGGTPSNVVSSFPDVTMKPFGYFLVAHHDYTGSTIPDLYYSNNSTSLAPNNTLVLNNQLQEEVDRVIWDDVPVLSEIVRLPDDENGNYTDNNSTDDFIFASSTPFNSESPSRPSWTPLTEQTSTSIESSGAAQNLEFLKINEVMPNPADESEWVELFNLGSSTIILNDLSICDGRVDSCVIATLSGEIRPGEWFNVSISGSKLNNDGDSVILKDPSGNVIDAVVYTGSSIPAKGQSIAREIDGLGDWKVTETPTQGAANKIASPVRASANFAVGGGSPVLPSTEKTTSKPSSQKQAKETTITWVVKAPSVVIQNSSTLFDAHLSADPRGGDLLFWWDFGDGNFTEGAKVFHSFATSGIFLVTVLATSTQSTTGHKIITVKVDGGVTPVVLGDALVKPTTGEDEWIVLQSMTSTPFDIGGWRIGNGNDKWFTIPENTLIKPGRALRFYKTATHLQLVDSGGSILLTNKDGRVVDILEYGKAKRDEAVSNTTEAIAAVNTGTSKTKKVLGTKYLGLLSIAEAKELPVNAEAEVVGTVESLPGAPFLNYFYMRDESGGIQIYSFKKDFPKLTLGDTIRVRGTIGSSSGQKRLRTKIGSITKLSEGDLPKGEMVTLGDISSLESGVLIIIEGEITKVKGSALYLDDGATEIQMSLPQRANIDTKELSEGVFVKATGILESSNDSMRVVPRTKNDLIIIEKFSEQKKKPVRGTILGAVGVTMVGAAAALKKWFLK